MPRKERMEEAGGWYHVINRGNYRKWIFEEEGAKAAFEATLFEGCEKSGWLLHGFVVMDNHFHLAVETPRPNLGEGMRWLQSTFANRFNRYRKEAGHLFQGRYKSLRVESTDRMAWLCHYLHLNPVRAGVCTVDQLSAYRWSSYWYLQEKDRPKFLRLRTCLEGAGNLKDDKNGVRSYRDYLAWLSEDAPAKKQMEFERMSRGWAIGSEAFKIDVLADQAAERSQIKFTQDEAKEAQTLVWRQRLDRALQKARKGPADITSDKKSAGWKVAIADQMKTDSLCTNGWLAKALNMGTESAVSRYVTERRSKQR